MAAWKTRRHFKAHRQGHHGNVIGFLLIGAWPLSKCSCIVGCVKARFCYCDGKADECNALPDKGLRCISMNTGFAKYLTGCHDISGAGHQPSRNCAISRMRRRNGSISSRAFYAEKLDCQPIGRDLQAIAPDVCRRPSSRRGVN